MPLDALVQGCLAADDVQRGDHGVGDLVRQSLPFRVWPTRCLPPLGEVRAVAIARAVLPTPPGPTTTTSRCAESRSDRAASSASRPTSSTDSDGRLPAGPWSAIGIVVRPAASSDASWVEDLLLELLQVRTGVEAELVGQAVANPLVGGQCIGLAAFPVQRGDQQHPQALLEGVSGDGSFQLADHITCLAQPQTGPRTRSR